MRYNVKNNITKRKERKKKKISSSKIMQLSNVNFENSLDESFVIF